MRVTLQQSVKGGQALSGEVLTDFGLIASSAGEAFNAVEAILCGKKAGERQVYAVVIKKNARSKMVRDHLLLMDHLIAATKRGIKQLGAASIHQEGNSAGLQKVFEHDGVRIFRGCASREEFRNTVPRTEGYYLFPAEMKAVTLRGLGLGALPKLGTKRIVIQVDAEAMMLSQAHKNQDADEEQLDRDSSAWRHDFTKRYRLLTAQDVALEAGTTARNRSATASRWAADKKIFSVRYQGQTLYPEFQIRDGLPVPVISKVLDTLPPHFTGWDVAFFLTTPNAYIDNGKPVDLLVNRPEIVKDLAHAFGHSSEAF